MIYGRKVLHIPYKLRTFATVAYIAEFHNRVKLNAKCSVLPAFTSLETIVFGIIFDDHLKGL